MRHRHLDEYALKDPDALPSEYIRKHSWFVFHQDRSSVKNRHKLGTAHLMWGSHFPYEDANWPDDRQQAMRVTDEVAAEDRQRPAGRERGPPVPFDGPREGVHARRGRRGSTQLVHF